MTDQRSPSSPSSSIPAPTADERMALKWAARAAGAAAVRHRSLVGGTHAVVVRDIDTPAVVVEGVRGERALRDRVQVLLLQGREVVGGLDLAEATALSFTLRAGIVTVRRGERVPRERERPEPVRDPAAMVRAAERAARASRKRGGGKKGGGATRG